MSDDIEYEPTTTTTLWWILDNQDFKRCLSGHPTAAEAQADLDSHHGDTTGWRIVREDVTRYEPKPPPLMVTVKASDLAELLDDHKVWNPGPHAASLRQPLRIQLSYAYKNADLR